MAGKQEKREGLYCPEGLIERVRGMSVGESEVFRIDEFKRDFEEKGLYSRDALRQTIVCLFSDLPNHYYSYKISEKECSIEVRKLA